MPQAPTILTGPLVHFAWWLGHHVAQSGDPRLKDGGPGQADVRQPARVTGHEPAQPFPNEPTTPG